MSSLQPESPLDGEWDQVAGKPFSEGILTQGLDDDASGVTQARVEALNDTLRPLDRYDKPTSERCCFRTIIQ